MLRYPGLRSTLESSRMQDGCFHALDSGTPSRRWCCCCGPARFDALSSSPVTANCHKTLPSLAAMQQPTRGGQHRRPAAGSNTAWTDLNEIVRKEKSAPWVAPRRRA